MPTSLPPPAHGLVRGLVRLDHLGLIRARGQDAANFLHNQLSTDFLHLDARQARLAAYCSPKGRMLASFVGLSCGEEDIALICHRSLLAATLARLRMFVLRARCRLEDATADCALFGLWGESAQQYMGGPAEPAEPWARRDVDGSSAIALHPAQNTARALLLAPAASPAPEGPPLAESVWLHGEVLSGVATLSQPVVDALVPQMLNYESVGGVDFKKGCWPGQEVVARSQFRGTIKRRAFVAHADGELAAGMEIFTPDDPQQPVGLVVQAAAHPAGRGWAAIVCLQTSAASGQALVLPSGAALQLQALPYPLLEDI